MFTTNHFAELSSVIPSPIMQAFVVIMILFVIGGTLFDVIHKQSATYFFNAGKKARSKATNKLSGGDKVGVIAKTTASEILTSSEFCNPKRRIAHLLGMYGFIIYLVATLVMVFGYPTDVSGTPAIWPALWAIGALMVCVGGYWFWFFIRVDVSAEGNSVFRVVKADLFILSLVLSSTFALIWAFLQSAGNPISGLFLAFYLIATIVLFGGVPWSKFAHMFFKPAAAIQKKMSVADGSLDNLPRPADRSNPEDSDRHSMELLKDAPMNMGLGIKREQPNHY